MRNLKLLLSFLIMSCIVACSSSTPPIISELESLQIPVVQPSSPDIKIDYVKMKKLFQENEEIIKGLTFLLKDRYLKDSKNKNVFDTHGFYHQVYSSLTKLEVASMVNKQYFSENNIKGLSELYEKLLPYKYKLINRQMG
jgi:hypothetical protein